MVLRERKSGNRYWISVAVSATVCLLAVVLPSAVQAQKLALSKAGADEEMTAVAGAVRG
jgi:hypothetical protein